MSADARSIHKVDFTAKVLELSTCHIPKLLATALTVESADVDQVSYDITTYGYLLWIGDPECDPDLPAELRPIYKMARQQGCKFVLLDCDALVCTELPLWEW